MPRVNVFAAAPTVRTAHPRVVIHSEDKKQLTIPLAAPIRHSGLAAKYETHERVGQYDTLHKTGNPMHVMTVAMTWVGRGSGGRIDAEKSIESELQLLRFFAREGLRLWFTGWGGSTGGWFRITDLDVETLAMKHGTNDITAATVSLTLTKPPDQLPNGPIAGGAKTSKSATPTTITTKAGQTLYAAAYQATGDGENWRLLADHNGVLPHRVAAGTTLRIPR